MAAVARTVIFSATPSFDLAARNDWVLGLITSDFSITLANPAVGRQGVIELQGNGDGRLTDVAVEGFVVRFEKLSGSSASVNSDKCAVAGACSLLTYRLSAVNGVNICFIAVRDTAVPDYTSALAAAIGPDLLYYFELDAPSSSVVTLAGVRNNELAAITDRIRGVVWSAATAGARPAYFASGTANGKPSMVLQDLTRQLSAVISLVDANRVGVFMYCKQALQSDLPAASGWFLLGLRSSGGAVGRLAFGRTNNRRRLVATFTGGVQDLTATSPSIVGRWGSVDFLPAAAPAGAVWRVDGVVCTPDFAGADTTVAADRLWFGGADVAFPSGELAFLVLVDLSTTDWSPVINTHRATNYQSTDVPAANRGGWPTYQTGQALYTAVTDCTHWGQSDETGRQWIVQYNHATGVITRTLLYTAPAPELHRCPTTIQRASDGRLVTFYSFEADLRKIAVHISTNPGDSTAWGARIVVDPGNVAYYYYYLQPFQLTGESGAPIYLFFKNQTAGAPGSSNVMAQWYMKSGDGGATWGGLTEVFEAAGQRPYMAAAPSGTARVDMLFSKGHPNETPAGGGGVYFAYRQGGNYYKTAGTLIGSTAFGPANADTIYDGAQGPAFIIDVANIAGNPVALYQYSTSRTNLIYVYARWNGAAWIKTEITATAPRTVNLDEWFNGGVGCLDPADPTIVYLSVMIAGQIELYRYVTADDGATFTATAITLDSQYLNYSARVPRNASPDLQVLWQCGSVDSVVTFCLSAKSYPAHW